MIPGAILQIAIMTRPLVGGGDTIKENPQLAEKLSKHSSVFQWHVCVRLDFLQQKKHGNRWNVEVDRRIGLSSS